MNPIKITDGKDITNVYNKRVRDYILPLFNADQRRYDVTPEELVAVLDIKMPTFKSWVRKIKDADDKLTMVASILSVQQTTALFAHLETLDGGITAKKPSRREQRSTLTKEERDILRTAQRKQLLARGAKYTEEHTETQANVKKEKKVVAMPDVETVKDKTATVVEREQKQREADERRRRDNMATRTAYTPTSATPTPTPTYARRSNSGRPTIDLTKRG